MEIISVGGMKQTTILLFKTVLSLCLTSIYAQCRSNALRTVVFSVCLLT